MKMRLEELEYAYQKIQLYNHHLNVQKDTQRTSTICIPLSLPFFVLHYAEDKIC